MGFLCFCSNFKHAFVGLKNRKEEVASQQRRIDEREAEEAEAEKRKRGQMIEAAFEQIKEV